MSFGVKVVLSWDLGQVQAVGRDLVSHSNDLRACFSDFKGKSDLAHAWSGTAASAQQKAATTLATDLYDLSDMMGLLGNQIGRVSDDLVDYQNAIRKAVAQATDAGFTVSDDGLVTVPPAKPGDGPRNRAIVEDIQTEAQSLQSTIVSNLNNAALEDINLAKALADAENTICHHATPAIVQQAVNFDPFPYAPGKAPNDPFLSDVQVGGTTPTPGDPNFATYWQALTPLEQQLAVQSWNKLGKNFNPYSTVQGGGLPAWAVAFNSQHNFACSSATNGLSPGYGYFGGGTIMGPDGKPWPIVAPYYSDGKHVYLADGGATRTDGGINQLDGQDPGWHTVSSYTGVNQFGTVSGLTKVAVAGEILTGQELETNPTDPSAVSIGPDGKPELGQVNDNRLEAPADKPFWDVDQPKEGEEYGAGELVKAGGSSIIQTGQAIQGVNDVSSHAQREWQVQYQVNDDGRVRAVVNTYTSGPAENGGTNVGSFTNAFPDGQHGSTSEIPVDTRYNPYTQPTLTQGTPSDVHYLGDPSRNGDVLDNSVPIQEKLNK